MKQAIYQFSQSLLNSAKDLAPIVLVIAFFQLIVLQQPIPDFNNILLGAGFVLIGLTLFMNGLKLGLFPIGEVLAFSFVKKGSIFWLITFSFALGFGATIAEPDLIVMANEAARVAQFGGVISTEIELNNYAQTLRYSVAVAV
jgi:hypothetical protein